LTKRFEKPPDTFFLRSGGRGRIRLARLTGSLAVRFIGFFLGFLRPFHQPFEESSYSEQQEKEEIFHGEDGNRYKVTRLQG
jgi:hypothetical protein